MADIDNELFNDAPIAAEAPKETKKSKSAKTSSPEEGKRVRVKLPLNKGVNAVQEEFFSVNFKNYIIKRGEYVDIPEELKEVIDNGEEAEVAAYQYAEEKKLREA